MKTDRLLPLLALILLLGSACDRHRQVTRVPVPLPSPSGEKGGRTPEPGYTEIGYASWYGDPYHGRRAASGEIYDQYKLTAAHRTLPFGTQVKVTNLENSRTVVVRINDRGPFVRGRIVDLSLTAAREIRMVGPGTAMVRLEIISANGDLEAGLFAVQVGAFRDRANAERLAKQLGSRYGNASIEGYDSSRGGFYRVRVGTGFALEQANQLAIQLGREKLPSFVVRVDN